MVLYYVLYPVKIVAQVTSRQVTKKIAKAVIENEVPFSNVVDYLPPTLRDYFVHAMEENHTHTLTAIFHTNICVFRKCIQYKNKGLLFSCFATSITYVLQFCGKKNKQLLVINQLLIIFLDKLFIEEPVE